MHACTQLSVSEGLVTQIVPCHNWLPMPSLAILLLQMVLRAKYGRPYGCVPSMMVWPCQSGPLYFSILHAVDKCMEAIANYWPYHHLLADYSYAMHALTDFQLRKLSLHYITCLYAERKYYAGISTSYISYSYCIFMHVIVAFQANQVHACHLAVQLDLTVQ